MASAHLRDLNDRNRRMLGHANEDRGLLLRRAVGQSSLPYWMLTLSMGKALTCAALEWGEKALTALNAQEASAARSPQPSRNARRKNVHLFPQTSPP